MSDDYDNGPRASTNLTGRRSPMYSCKPCDGTGVRSDAEGRPVLCLACDGTTMATARQGDRIRASWGPRILTR
jgi:DnaJ-class molecular chaperone